MDRPDAAGSSGIVLEEVRKEFPGGVVAVSDVLREKLIEHVGHFMLLVVNDEGDSHNLYYLNIKMKAPRSHPPDG